MTYTVTRDVTPDECWWLAKAISRGSTVYRCVKPTYGSTRGPAFTFDPDGGYPFFELPHDAVSPTEGI